MTSLLEPGTSFGDYVVDAVIGRGGMSVVYRARELHPDRVVALKLLDPDLAQDENFRKRFLRESDLAANIGHPNIVPIFDAGEADGQLFIAMPLIEGSDLGMLLRREGPLPLRGATAIVEQVGRALDAGHAKGLVHRDVKPANVLLAPPAEPGDPPYAYLADFGLARRTTTSLKLTQHATFLGTREYAAPEQIRGEDVDGRADIYALGCVVYETLTGAPPFEAESESELIYAHLEREPPPVAQRRAGVPASVDAVIARAMAKNRDDRYTSCRQLTAALQAIPVRDAGPTVAEGATAADRGTEIDGATEIDRAPAGGARQRRLKLATLIAAVIVLPLVGFAIVKLAGGGDGRKKVAATRTYSNAQLGVSFNYPARWHEKRVEPPGVAFGDDQATCGFERQSLNSPPAATQAAQLDYVRGRARNAAQDASRYDLRAIQPESGKNVQGAGILRTSTVKGEAKGVHIVFFFHGSEADVLDCTTTPELLDKLDAETFRPLLASFRIGA
jgi:hypothetical protein